MGTVVELRSVASPLGLKYFDFKSVRIRLTNSGFLQLENIGTVAQGYTGIFHQSATGAAVTSNYGFAVALTVGGGTVLIPNQVGKANTNGSSWYIGDMGSANDRRIVEIFFRVTEFNVGYQHCIMLIRSH